MCAHNFNGGVGVPAVIVECSPPLGLHMGGVTYHIGFELRRYVPYPTLLPPTSMLIYTPCSLQY